MFKILFIINISVGQYRFEDLKRMLKTKFIKELKYMTTVTLIKIQNTTWQQPGRHQLQDLIITNQFTKCLIYVGFEKSIRVKVNFNL